MTDRTRHILQHLVSFLIGAGAAMCLCLTCNPIKINNSKDVLVRSDTIVRYETVHYSGLELSRKTIKLDVPEISTKELIYIAEASLDTIYRDSVRYVTLPREYYYTKVRDAEIWHSGVDSRIDSLNVFSKEVYVTDTYKRQTKNAVILGVEADYRGRLYAPMYLQYERQIKPWFALYGRVEYEAFTGQIGAGLGAKVSLLW